MTHEYVWGPTEHLADVLEEAILRFAREDSCTPEQWAGRAVRYVVCKRLEGERALQEARELKFQ